MTFIPVIAPVIPPADGEQRRMGSAQKKMLLLLIGCLNLALVFGFITRGNLSFSPSILVALMTGLFLVVIVVVKVISIPSLDEAQIMHENPSKDAIMTPHSRGLRYCDECGSRLGSDRSQYCPNCGHWIN